MKKIHIRRKKEPWYRWRFSPIVLFLLSVFVFGACRSLSDLLDDQSEQTFLYIAPFVFLTLAMPVALAYYLWRNKTDYDVDIRNYPELTVLKAQDDNKANAGDARTSPRDEKSRY